MIKLFRFFRFLGYTDFEMLSELFLFLDVSIFIDQEIDNFDDIWIITAGKTRFLFNEDGKYIRYE